ncbi:type VI secretion system protein ImpH [Roseateles sp. YR242]|uniref:type VI secretion system baseplate subunit TssG n=1 Tax=Roseateles sp. YR242 TaxID=1855305 RepID=UPI0008CBE79C|nr:type VI secretion system baseplate subunit TssG [Roseateles sp. YR242]SEK22508.1 type VI secretion system protein ImpH [Roseateles sp. YR242]
MNRDLFHLLRQLETLRADRPPLGHARRPSLEPVRLHQPASLEMTSPGVSDVGPGQGRDSPPPVHVHQHGFGLLGPHGPLPLWLTEWVAGLARHDGQPAAGRFLDLLSHRFGMLLYRAWAQAQVTVDAQSQAGTWLNALTGRHGADASDVTPAPGRLAFAAPLWSTSRSPALLAQWCAFGLNVPARVCCWQGAWLPVPSAWRCGLGQGSQRLGQDVLLGGHVWEVDHRIRLVLGPLSLAEFRQLQPGGPQLVRLRTLMAEWLGLGWQWDVQLVLRPDQCPSVRLDHGTRLGHDSWLARRPGAGPADDRTIGGQR